MSLHDHQDKFLVPKDPDEETLHSEKLYYVWQIKTEVFQTWRSLEW